MLSREATMALWLIYEMHGRGDMVVQDPDRALICFLDYIRHELHKYPERLLDSVVRFATCGEVDGEYEEILKDLRRSRGRLSR